MYESFTCIQQYGDYDHVGMSLITDYIFNINVIGALSCFINDATLSISMGYLYTKSPDLR